MEEAAPTTLLGRKLMEESVIVFALKTLYCQVRKVAQQVMCWPHKYEDGSLALQNPHKG